MSMHRIELTEVELEGLKAHGLDIGKPSQLSDAFRVGVSWALKAAYCKQVGSDSYHGLDSCDDYRDWVNTLTTNTHKG